MSRYMMGNAVIALISRYVFVRAMSSPPFLSAHNIAHGCYTRVTAQLHAASCCEPTITVNRHALYPTGCVTLTPWVRCATMQPMLFKVLGNLAIEGDSGSSVAVTGQMRRLLLGILLATPNRALSFDELAESMWGEDQPEAPDPAIRVHVSRLRSDLGDGESTLVTRSPGYLLRIGPDELDAQIFERLVQEADRSLANGAFGVASDKLRSGLSLWRGSAYEPFLYEAWAQPEIRRLSELHKYAVEQRIETDLHLGRHDQLVPELESLIAVDPLREKLWGQLMIALYRAGRQGDALRTFGRARDTLLSDLGVDPSADLKQLELRILNQDPSLSVVAQSEQPPTEREIVVLTIVLSKESTSGGDHLNDLSSIIVSGGGDVFEARDERVLASFDEVIDALRVAIRIVQPNAGSGNSVARAAIDTATVEATDGGFRGLGINRTLRIAGSATPGQVLLSSAAAQSVGGELTENSIELHSMGKRDIPGVTSPVDLFELVTPKTGSDHADTVGNRITNLPVQLSSFVGRVAELEELNELLSAHRMVTVTGPGGAGKTRLGLQVASDAIGTVQDGVWWIELGAVSDPTMLPVVFAEAIGLTEGQNDDPAQSLRDSLSNLEVLLVVDNCEHLIDDIAALTLDLLQSSPGVSVLATSREPLGIPGEQIWGTPVMSVPDPEHLPPIEQLLRNDAINLFVDRSRSALGTFALTTGNARVIAEICGQVDGLPLAIELLSAQLRYRDLAEVASGIQSYLRTRGPHRTIPNRHHTLEAATDWSYRLLDQDEQAMFLCLSVFPDSFNRAAAIVVGAETSVDQSATSGLLDQLVNKSLVSAVGDIESRRFRVLEPLRAFASARLDKSHTDTDLKHTAHDRHETFFADWSDMAYENTAGPDQAEWLERQRLEQSNAVAALHWALQQGHQDTAESIAASYGWYWLLRGPRRVGLNLVERVIKTVVGTPNATGRRLLMSAGYLAGELNDHQAARNHLEAKLKADEAAEDVEAAAATLSNLGVVAEREHDHNGALRYLNRALEILSSEPTEGLVGEYLSGVHGNISSTLRHLGESNGAAQHAEECIRFAREGSNTYLEEWALIGAAEVEIDVGRLLDAAQKLQSAEGMAETIGDELAVYSIAVQRSRIHVSNGDFDDARILAERAWHIAKESGNESRLPDVADQVALVALLMGDLRIAEEYANMAAGIGTHEEPRTSSLELLACIAIEQGKIARAADLLSQARALQEERGCVTSADLVGLVARAEATCENWFGYSLGNMDPEN